MSSRHLLRRWGIAIIIMVGVLIAVIPTPIVFSAPTDRTIHIEARSFQYTPEAIHVNPGDRVTLELSSADYVHGLYLDGYDLNLVADPGQTARLTFTADRTGSFRMRCSVTCGALHPFMIGKFNVGSNDLLWRALGLAALAAFAGIWWVRR
jgi:heme/copper-type cytochrome/quinol oxidase subunit 2